MNFALLKDARALWQARALVAVMTRRELAARHAGTAAGVLWAYVQPVLTVAAFYLVFDVIASVVLMVGFTVKSKVTILSQPAAFVVG